MPVEKQRSASLEVIAGCLRHDPRSQHTLYQQYHHSLFSVCISYTRNEETALEALQDGFLKIFQQLHTFDRRKSCLYTWMRTIVVRTAIDALRRQAKQPGAVALTDAGEPPVGAEAVEWMSADEIRFLVTDLPATTQVVFRMYVQEGYNHREIGERLNISEGTSKWHLSEARKYLSGSLRMLEKAG